MDYDTVALLRSSLDASEHLVRSQEAHIEKLELQLDLFRSSYEAAAVRSKQLDPLSENSFQADIPDRARPDTID